MSNSTAEDIAGKIEKYFRDKGDILLAFIFGSAVSGRFTGQSDVDIAVLFSNAFDASGFMKIRNEAADAAGREIDLVVLNDASPVIRMQVLKNGKMIKSTSTSIYRTFIVRTVKEYDDLLFIKKKPKKVYRGETL